MDEEKFLGAHWPLSSDGKKVMSYVRAEDAYLPIAVVTNERAVRHMLRYAHLGEQVEAILDQLESGSIGNMEALGKIDVKVRDAIRDTDGRAQIAMCPQIHAEPDRLVFRTIDTADNYAECYFEVPSQLLLKFTEKYGTKVEGSSGSVDMTQLDELMESGKYLGDTSDGRPSSCDVYLC